jgi:hypothetical protein
MRGRLDGFGPRFGQFCFAHAGGAFGQDRFAEFLGQVDDGGDFVGGDVLLFTVSCKLLTAN